MNSSNKLKRLSFQNPLLKKVIQAEAATDSKEETKEICHRGGFGKTTEAEKHLPA